jgi:hypothetical protein
MDELDLLEQAEKKQEGILARFFKRLKIVATRFVDPVMEILDQLSMKTNDRLSDWSKVTQAGLYLRPQLSIAGYDGAVLEMLDEMKGVQSGLNDYFKPFDRGDELTFFQKAGEGSLARVQQDLLGPVAEVAFVAPVAEALQNAVMRGQTVSDLRRSVREIVIESELPASFVQSKSRQELWMWHRNYSSSIGAALDLTHFYYDGVAVKHSREFCLQRKGKAFKKEEIESWADLDWQGKIPGTTKESIFWLCGGYNCIDVLRPITEQLYNRFTNNN